MARARVAELADALASRFSAREVSDDLYGSGSRYASKQRLEAMLDNECAQLLTQLEKARGSRTRFFSSVDTVSARNLAGTNDPHGWIGLRFQSQPGGLPNDVLLHVNMLDPAKILQQEAIGILGVNLIYAAFYELETKESFRAATNFAAISNTGSLIFTYTSRGLRFGMRRADCAVSNPETVTTRWQSAQTITGWRLP